MDSSLHSEKVRREKICVKIKDVQNCALKARRKMVESLGDVIVRAMGGRQFSEVQDMKDSHLFAHRTQATWTGAKILITSVSDSHKGRFTDEQTKRKVCHGFF